MFGEERAVWKKGVEGNGARAEAWRLDSRCVGFRIVGFMNEEFAKKVTALIDDAVADAPIGGKYIAFCDYEKLTGADPKARTLIQDTVKLHKQSFEVFHYLVASKMIALAVQVAGLWHGIPSKTWTSKALIELEFVRVAATTPKAT